MDKIVFEKIKALFKEVRGKNWNLILAISITLLNNYDKGKVFGKLK